MKYISILLFLFLAMACKKENHDDYKSYVIISESTSTEPSTVAFKGTVISHPHTINLKEHGFRIIINGLDTTINLGPRNMIGNFEFTLTHSYFEVGTNYDFTSYIVDETNHILSSKVNSAVVGDTKTPLKK